MHPFLELCLAVAVIAVIAVIIEVIFGFRIDFGAALAGAAFIRAARVEQTYEH